MRFYLVFLLGTQKATIWMCLLRIPGFAMTPRGSRREKETRVRQGDRSTEFCFLAVFCLITLVLSLFTTPNQSAQLPTFPHRKTGKADWLVIFFLSESVHGPIFVDYGSVLALFLTDIRLPGLCFGLPTPLHSSISLHPFTTVSIYLEVRVIGSVDILLRLREFLQPSYLKKPSETQALNALSSTQ